jgi:adenylate kinase family enzyme
MKIFVMGASGSGTSTLGRGLSRRLNLLHADSDDFYWEETDPPFTIPRAPEQLHERFYNFVKAQNFVLSGDVLNWGLPERDVLDAFSHVIFIYVPWEEREQRLRQREHRRYGARIMQGGDMHETFENFIEWSKHYDSGLFPGRNKKSQSEFVMKFRKNGGMGLEINGRLSAEELLNEVFMQIKK